MARKFPYENASIYLAWRFLRGSDYARSLFPGVAVRTFYDWEERHRTDPELQQLVKEKKSELGLDELRTETIDFMRWVYAETKAIVAIAKAETENPRRIAALADMVKAIATAGNLASDVYVDTDPLPPEAPNPFAFGQGGGGKRR